MSIFRTGKIIITGARTMDQIEAAYVFLNKVFQEHAATVLIKRA
jgi:TATA-box binding protein (TBP) (component of TFIID and TFIIIB)